MTLNFEPLEYGLKVFYKLKYKKEQLEFTELPAVVENIRYLKNLLRIIEGKENIPLEISQYIKLEELLDQYFRNEFVESRDRSSIEEYLMEKNSGDFEFNLYTGMLHSKNKTSTSYKWLENTYNTIQRIKEYRRYDFSTVIEIVKSLPFESFNNKEIKLVFNEFFTDQLEDIFAQVHVNKVVRVFTIQEVKKHSVITAESKLTINQIALLHFYTGTQITRENGNAIAKEHGHNSGEKLFQRFTHYSSASNRRGKPTPLTPKKLENKIELIESVILLLPIDKSERAKDEVSILKAIYEAEYQ